MKPNNTEEKASFTFNPLITYVDEVGEPKTCNPRKLTITIQPTQKKGKMQTNVSEGTPEKNDAEIDILKKFGLNR